MMIAHNFLLGLKPFLLLMFQLLLLHLPKMHGVGFEVSNKTTVISSSMQLATHIQDELRNASIFIKQAPRGERCGL